jgi:hypothetical protein
MASDLESAAQLALQTMLTATTRHPEALGPLFNPVIARLRSALDIETPDEEAQKQWGEYLQLFARSGRPEHGMEPIPLDSWAAMSDVSKIGQIELLSAEAHACLERQRKQAIAVKLQAEEAKAIAERPASFGAW